MSLIKYPYTNLHEINLDWIIEEVKKCYSPDNPPTMAVISVNGMTGAVTLYTDPAVNFPEVEENSWTIGRTAGGATVGIKFNKTLPLQRVNGTSLFNIYDAGNPPPYPVTSVNGQTGDITIQVAFNSLTGDTISFITPSPAHSWSIDRETLDGAISLKLDTTNDTPSAYLEYVSSDETITRSIKLLTPDDIPSSSGVVSVNGEAGVVSLTGDDIPKEDNSSVSVASAINGLEDDTENLNSKIGNTAMGTTATTVTGAIKEHSTAISNVNTKIGNVDNTSLQDQITGINGKIGSVGNTSLQDQITGINGKIGSVGNTSLQDQVDAIDTKLTPTYSAVTLASGITGNVVIMRMGKLRVITGYFNPNNSGTNITIATLDSQDAPPVNIAGNFSGFGVTATGELNITSAGVLQCSVNATPTNTLKFNITYGVA